MRPSDGIDHRIPVAAVAAAVTAWGAGNVLVKLASFDGVVLSLYRLWVAVVLMVVVMPLSGHRLTLRNLREALPGGVLFGVNIVMFFSALKLTSVANATLISALQPALVLAVAGPWFGERIGPREVGWAGVALAGVVLVVVGSAGTPEWSPGGDALAVGAVVTFTGYFLVSKRRRADFGAIEYVAAVQLVAAVVVTPIAIASGQEFTRGDALDWVWVLTIAGVGGIGGHVLLNWAHHYVDVSVSSLMMLGVPVVGAMAAWIVLDEALSPLQIGGGLVTLAALVAVVRRPQPSAVAETAAGGVSMGG